MSGSVRIGNALGANDFERAKVAAFCTDGLCLGSSVVCGLSVVALQRFLISTFTSDLDIETMTKSLIWVVPLFQYADGINAAMQVCTPIQNSSYSDIQIFIEIFRYSKNH